MVIIKTTDYHTDVFVFLLRLDRICLISDYLPSLVHSFIVNHILFYAWNYRIFGNAHGFFDMKSVYCNFLISDTMLSIVIEVVFIDRLDIDHHISYYHHIFGLFLFIFSFIF